MTKRNKLLISYLVTMCLITFVRICFTEEYFGVLDDSSLDILFATLCQIVCMGIVPIVGIYLASKDKSPRAIFTELGFKRVKGGQNILIIVAICILHAVINGGVSTAWSVIVKSTGYTSVVSDPTVYLNFGEFLLGVLFTAVLPGFFEEITHRGLAFRMTGGDFKKKVIVTALLFAFMHQNIMQTGYTFVGGLMFGALTAITGSIFPAMLAHFLNNLFVVIRTYSDSFGGIISQAVGWIYSISYTVWGMILLTALWAGAVLLAIMLYIKLYKSYQKSEISPRVDIALEEESANDKILSRALWVAIFLIGASTTVFSYIWGLLR